jgi:1,4-alpha-glucan branching enzyme
MLFFIRTGYARTQNYVIKWLTDYITEYGIDGYRADNMVKHVDASVWLISKTQVITHSLLGKITKSSIGQQTHFILLLKFIITI